MPSRHAQPVRRTALVALLLAIVAPPAAAVQVQDVARLKGAETSTLIGMGLVVGLKGTGDGDKFLPAMRPLAAIMQHLIDPNVIASELKDAKNVALVALTAKLPGAGVREGDHVDVHLASVGPAKSLQGGRLFLIPLTGPLPNSPVFAYAEGPITTEDPAVPTTGVVKNGAQLTRDVSAKLLDAYGRITLVLHDANASWPMANHLASLINGVLAPDGPNVARALDPKNVVVEVPVAERADPAAFVSQILESYVDPSQITSGAKVVINERTGTIIITGEVQISPVIISHKGLTITSITPPPRPTAQNPQTDTANFLALNPDKRDTTKLADLLAAFNQLKVEAPDRIAIIKEIHKSGKLHAQLVLE